MEVHSNADCCGGHTHEQKRDSKNEIMQEPKMEAVNQTKSSGCCGEKGQKHSHGHNHSQGHNHSHGHGPENGRNGGERKAPAGGTSVFSTVLGDEVVVTAEESKAHQEHHKRVQTTLLLDNLGIFASTLCLIHCMAMPFLIAFLPFLGLQFLEGELAHRIIALFVFGFAIFAIGPGYMQHRRKQVLVATIFGLSLVAGALLVAGPIFGEQYELPFITTGNLILVVTHLRNRKLCQCVH